MDSKYFYFKMMEIVDLSPLSPTVPSNFPDKGEMLAWSKIDPRHLASLYVLTNSL